MRRASSGLMPIVALDRKANRSLQGQIYDALRAAIVGGELKPGQLLPSSRRLAAEIGSSRIPALNAYAQLLAEGYIETKAGSGTAVAATLPELFAHCGPAAPKASSADASGRHLSQRSGQYPNFVATPRIHNHGAFVIHQPAIDQFPFHIWGRLAARHHRSPGLKPLIRIDPMGTPALRQAICDYLATARAVRCTPEQVMVVSGSQQALDLCCRVLLDPDDCIWMEEPGYFLARYIFQANGCRLVPVKVDAHGLSVTEGEKACSTARAAYVTPSHQFPLGATMSAARRIELLRWAGRANAWIIEDDYDSEFRFESPPVASLQGLDPNGRVIYIGTFSKVLLPALRLGYIVIPADLVERFQAVRFCMDIFPCYFSQAALADFMLEGHFVRHIRKMRLLYGQRRAALIELLRREFGEAVTIHGSDAGMSVTASLPHGFDDQDIARRALERKLWLFALSPLYAGASRRNGFILGFGSTPSSAMPGAVKLLAELAAASRQQGRKTKRARSST